MSQRHRIQFPPILSHLNQDESYFYLVQDDEKKKIRFHDYDEIYNYPNLYEQVIYERLKCKSPEKVGSILKQVVTANEGHFSELRILDMGAGNGIMGQVLHEYGVSRVVGADIIPEAKSAAERDRPGVYDQYYVADFADLDDNTISELNDWNLNCLCALSALGFSDVPTPAFHQALSLIDVGGWVAFNIKETFLDRSDTSGFSRFIRELIFSEYLDLHHLERYRHRLSMDGLPLFYYALVGQKTAEIPDDFLAVHGID